MTTNEVNISQDDSVTVVELVGELNTTTAPDIQKQILPLAEPGSKILLDMTQVGYMSSAGLRVLLSLYRQISASDGKIVLIGVNEEIENVMSVTGFLSFFTLSESREAGLAALS